MYIFLRYCKYLSFDQRVMIHTWLAVSHSWSVIEGQASSQPFFWPRTIRTMPSAQTLPSRPNILHQMWGEYKWKLYIDLNTSKFKIPQKLFVSPRYEIVRIENIVNAYFNQGKSEVVGWLVQLAECGSPLSLLRWGSSRLILHFWLRNISTKKVGKCPYWWWWWVKNAYTIKVKKQKLRDAVGVTNELLYSPSLCAAKKVTRGPIKINNKC